MAEENAEAEAEAPKEEATPEENKKEGEKSPDSQDLIDNADRAADRLKRENDRKEGLLDREEKLRVKETLKGKAEGGKPAEESPEEYKDKVMRNEVGTAKKN